MKVIKINNCEECPYRRAYDLNAYYCRNTANYKIIDVKEGLPDWCPLEDYEKESEGDKR